MKNSAFYHKKTAHIIAVLSLVGLLVACEESGGSAGGSGTSAPQGQRGSTARMALVDDYLYAISGDTIQLFDVGDGDSPQAWTTVRVDFGIETLFPYGDYLLVGGERGVYILDNTDRASPTQVGEFTHAEAQDPVVANNDLAYVTLSRDPATFPGQENIDRLDVVDISDVTNPTLIHTVNLSGPRGLTVDGDRLHVCDGVSGLKTFSLENPREPTLLFSLPNDECNDVLMVNGNLVAVGDTGVSQYDVTLGRPAKISEINRQSVIYVVDP